MSRSTRIFAILIFSAGTLLSACAPALSPTPSAPQPPSATPSPQPSATPTPTLKPSPTPQPLTAICTPLLDHDLADLPKYITQPFIPPAGSNKEEGHHGVDFGYYHRDEIASNPPLEGNPVQSVLDGRVAGIGYAPVYGYYLIVETPGEWLPAAVVEAYAVEPGQSLYLLYAHMQTDAPFVPGDALACGQQVGQVGKSGDPQFIAEAHLHLETRVGPSGVIFDPMSYYTTSATEAEKAEYETWRSSGTFSLYDPMTLLTLGAE